ncbi:uncharacterized protein PAC_18810 [Phialocephala subalpina]|uniref:DUF8004 domain-containing protein n=1 Tax=Phialocephala subalpina TaxID=576137 RepID=A0A1L7XV84_9HELO|nr:uncharacterized protein PAC_18810 [Phialocephala subalpina]
MDHEPLSLPRVRDSSPYQHHQHNASRNTLSQPPPIRAPPPAPLGVNVHASEDVISGGYTDKLWQDGPPSRAAPIPRQEDAEYSHSEDLIDWQSGHHSQSPSPPPPQIYTPPPRTDSRGASPLTLDTRRPRAESLLTSPSQPNSNAYGSRSVSTPLNLRPNSTPYDSDGEGRMDRLNDMRRRSSMMLGNFNILGGSRPPSEDRGSSVRPWVLALDGKARQPYAGLEYLMNGEKIPELWDLRDVGDLYVYFYPPASGRGPQVKCPSLVIETSQNLRELAQSGVSNQGRTRTRSFDGRGSLTIEDATRNLAVRNPASPPYTPNLSAQDPQSASDSSGESIRSFSSAFSGPRELHLYLPLAFVDGPEQTVRKENESPAGTAEREAREQLLIDARNLFAFLNGQTIVYTRNTSTPFRAFLAIARLLKLFGFNDRGGATYGQDVDIAFDFYLTGDYKFSDVRESREKTLEGLIIGEAMRSEILYREAFAHAVGKWDELIKHNSPLLLELSPKSRRMLEREYIDLQRYKKYVEERLTDFDFPSVFAGVANSTSSDESKVVRFKNWKSSFLALRKVVLSYYKKKLGSWPPRGSSKRNSFVEGGLNRPVLKDLYHDLCRLYDFLVDRDNITTRGMEANETASQAEKPTVISALRRVLNEFDKSTTWESPAMPLDVPLLPNLASFDPTFESKDPKEQQKEYTKRKLVKKEPELALEAAHNLRDGLKYYSTEFMHMYMAFEKKEATGKTIRELEEQRIGHWIFLYVVLQTLPLVISDAPGLNFAKKEVEYFLSATPPENMPWIEGRGSQMDLYQTAEGTYSRLPAHQVEFGINSIYSRSHCWTAANSWLAGEPTLEQPDISMPEGQFSPLAPPPGFSGLGGGELRPPSRGRSRSSSAGGVPRPHSVGGLLAVRDPNAAGSRVSSISQRNSIMLGLEKLPRFDGGDGWGGASPVLTTSSGDTAVKTPPERDVTFDDILAGMEQPGAKKGKGGLLKKGKK